MMAVLVLALLLLIRVAYGFGRWLLAPLSFLRRGKN
jgi:hypothetical protein